MCCCVLPTRCKMSSHQYVVLVDSNGQETKREHARREERHGSGCGILNEARHTLAMMITTKTAAATRGLGTRRGGGCGSDRVKITPSKPVVGVSPESLSRLYSAFRSGTPSPSLEKGPHEETPLSMTHEGQVERISYHPSLFTPPLSRRMFIVASSSHVAGFFASRRGSFCVMVRNSNYQATLATSHNKACARNGLDEMGLRMNREKR